MKKTFIFYADWLTYTEVMTDEERLNLYDSIIAYNQKKQLVLKGGVKYVRPKIKEQIDIDNQKYEEICEARRNAGKLGGRPANKQKKQKVTSESKGKQKNLDNDNDNHSISTNVDNIAKLITELKENADRLGIAYDKNMEWQFAKHIIHAKEFGEFASKIGLERTAFAKSVMNASVGIKFRKGACAGPRAIYQNYAEVYNQSKQKGTKSRVAVLPGVD